MDLDNVSTTDTSCGVCCASEQYMELRNMMQDLQDGFSEAVNELSKIQDEDKAIHNKIDSSRLQQDGQINEILNMVHSLKTQCNDIQYQLELTKKGQKKLEKQVKRLKTKEYLNQKNTNANGITPPVELQAGACYTSPMIRSYIASLPLPEEMDDIDDDHSYSDDSLAAITQKCLQLSTTLGQRSYAQQNDYQMGCEPEKASTCQNVAEEQNDITSQNSSSTGERWRLVQNLVESERNYCTTLYNIVEGYSKDIMNSGAITRADFTRIFPVSLTKIYEYHCYILKSMEQRLSRWKQQDVIGDIMSRFTSSRQVEILATYKDYIKNLNTGIKVVKRLNKTNEKFRSVFNNGQKESVGDRQTLINHLLAPARKLPSYVLTMKKILKHTDSYHPDTFLLESCVESMKITVQSLNEIMEQSLQQKPLENHNIDKRSVETSSSWSSHEEDQRMSTDTKDSGIHSNGDNESHDSVFHAEENNSKYKLDLLQRSKSSIDFMNDRKEKVYSRRCATPTIKASSYRIRSEGNQPISYETSNLSLSSPDLLCESSYNDSPRVKPKHKVQFRNPPEEQLNKRWKKRSIADTLRIFFNKRKSTKASNLQGSTTSNDSVSVPELLSPAPPEMFANDPVSHGNLDLDETYEDENGDPYSAV